jgi:hypothetical protein
MSLTNSLKSSEIGFLNYDISPEDDRWIGRSGNYITAAIDGTMGGDCGKGKEERMVKSKFNSG